MNWMEYLSNPKLNYLKQSMFSVLQEKYGESEPIIDRLGLSLVTEDDIRGFFKMIVNVYETGYMKAVEDHKEQLKQMGLEARIRKN